jgi:hypothetical protein
MSGGGGGGRWIVHLINKVVFRAGSQYCCNTRCVLPCRLVAETGTMSGGGGKPRGGRMKLGNAAPRAAAADGKAAAKELAATEAQLAEVEGQLRQTRNERWVDTAGLCCAVLHGRLSRLLYYVLFLIEFNSAA